MSAKGRTRWHNNPTVLGGVFLVFVVFALFAVYQKERITTWLSSGDEVKAAFPRSYQLEPNKSDVKIAGVVVGKVTAVDDTHGNSMVTAKVDDADLSKLGSAPSATIRPTTLLGGAYYLDLTPGGAKGAYNGSTIPTSRTHVPVELDKILAAIPDRAQDGIRNTTRLTDQSLQQGAGDALGRVLDDAPGTLQPAGEVLNSARGTRPDTDLWRLVPDLNSAADALTQQRGQLGRVVDSLHQVSGTLSSSRGALAATFGSLPRTLSDTRTGLGALHGSLDRLHTTAVQARPAVQELGPLLAKADPVLNQARPLVADLRPLLHEALPMVNQLVPTASDADATLAGIKGPVLDRVNGPITKLVLSPWRGTGAYQGDGSDHRFYEELGYLAAHTANLSKYHDKSGPMVGLALGAGVSSAGGDNPGTAQLLQSLGLLPGGGVDVPPQGNNSGDQYTPTNPTAPGKNQGLPGILRNPLGGPANNRSGQ